MGNWKHRKNDPNRSTPNESYMVLPSRTDMLGLASGHGEHYAHRLLGQQAMRVHSAQGHTKCVKIVEAGFVGVIVGHDESIAGLWGPIRSTTIGDGSTGYCEVR